MRLRNSSLVACVLICLPAIMLILRGEEAGPEDPGLEQRLWDLVRRFADDDYAVREKAAADLEEAVTRGGPAAYRAFRSIQTAQTGAAETEVVERCQRVLERLTKPTLLWSYHGAARTISDPGLLATGKGRFRSHALPKWATRRCMLDR